MEHRGEVVVAVVAARADEELEVLTVQERRILGLIGEGLTNRETARRMNLSEKTVKNYVSSLLHKLGFSRRTEAAVYATEHRREQHGRS